MVLVPMDNGSGAAGTGVDVAAGVPVAPSVGEACAVGVCVIKGSDPGGLHPARASTATNAIAMNKPAFCFFVMLFGQTSALLPLDDMKWCGLLSPRQICRISPVYHGTQMDVRIHTLSPGAGLQADGLFRARADPFAEVDVCVRIVKVQLKRAIYGVSIR